MFIVSCIIAVDFAVVTVVIVVVVAVVVAVFDYDAIADVVVIVYSFFCFLHCLVTFGVLFVWLFFISIMVLSFTYVFLFDRMACVHTCH